MMTSKKCISMLAAVLAAVNLCGCAAGGDKQASAPVPSATAAPAAPEATAAPEAAAVTSSVPSAAASGTAKEITVEEAKKIALAHAGLSESDVTFLHTEYEVKNGKAKYEVEFYKEPNEYDYDIDALSGEILSFDKDAEYIIPSVSPDASGKITEDQAYEIALAYAKISKDAATLKKKKLDREDGKEIFEIEFYADGKEYEFEIDAANGTVLKFEIDD